MGAESGGGASPGSAQGGLVNGEMGSDGAGGVAPTGDGKRYRPALLLVVNGKAAHEVKPWGPDWPLRRGNREIVIIAEQYVDDHEIPEIPLTHNVNDPIPGRPVGQGTPDALQSMQMAINSILSDLVHQVSVGSFPSYLIPESVQKARKELGEAAYIVPGTVLTIPDNLLLELKENVIRTLQPGQLSPDLWRFLEKLLELIDKAGDMANVLQGETDPGMSGKLFADASSAAQTTILFKSKRVEMMLKYLTKLMIGGLMTMTPDDCAAAVRKYPVYVWYAIHRWWKSGHFAYDTAAEITSGGGASKQAKANQLVNAASAGVQVSQQTRLEALDKDPDTELKNQIEWARKVAQAMPQQEQEQPGDSKGKGNPVDS